VVVGVGVRVGAGADSGARERVGAGGRAEMGAEGAGEGSTQKEVPKAPVVTVFCNDVVK
jgi:hypothetical protein